jgi:hypothetical protein
MSHFASRAFWEAYEMLPANVRELADQNFELLKKNPQHPSLISKRSGTTGLCASGGATERSLWKLTTACCGSGSVHKPTMTR